MLRWNARLERRRTAWALRAPVHEAYRPRRGNWLRRLRVVAGDPQSWKDLAWLSVLGSFGFVSAVIAVTMWGTIAGLLVLPAWSWSLPNDGVDFGLFRADSLGAAFIGVDIGIVAIPVAYVLQRWMTEGLLRLSQALLSPSREAALEARVGELAATRAGAVDAAAAELQRIERDLHDGAQARLVALAMDLGMAEDRFARDPEGARELVGEAREEAKRALAELRDLARGIRPSLLAERGLGPALTALAARSPVPRERRPRRARRPAARGREHHLVRRLGGARQRGQAQPRRARAGQRRLRRGAADRRGRRRRRRRRERGRQRAGGPAQARRGARRHARRLEPARRAHGDPGGAAMRVVIAEDLALLRDGLIRLLRDTGFEVVAAVEHPDAFLEAVQEHRPDVCVVDVRLPPTFSDEGVRAALEARRRVPGLPILILSQYVEQTFAAELFADGRGGVGYLLKDRVADVADFVASVKRVAEGGTALDPEAVAQLLVPAGPDDPLAALTPREADVMQLMAEGRTNHAIAHGLHISESAVEKHVSTIFGKLDLPRSEDDHRRVMAVAAYLRR